MAAEARAIAWALNLAIIAGIIKIIIDGYSKIRFDAPAKSYLDPSWEVSPTLHDVEFLATSFEDCQFIFLKKCYSECV